MASKEVMIVTPEDIHDHVTLSASAADTLKWLVSHAGIEMDDDARADFVVMRGLRDNDIRELWELKAWCEKVIDCLKTVCKHAYNVGGEETLPKNVSWSKQSYTYEWAEETHPSGIAKGLVDSGLATEYDFLDTVSVNAMAKAAGITVEKLMQLYPEHIVMKPKERTLKIK